MNNISLYVGIFGLLISICNTYYNLYFSKTRKLTIFSKFVGTNDNLGNRNYILCYITNTGSMPINIMDIDVFDINENMIENEVFNNSGEYEDFSEIKPGSVIIVKLKKIRYTTHNNTKHSNEYVPYVSGKVLDLISKNAYRKSSIDFQFRLNCNLTTGEKFKYICHIEKNFSDINHEGVPFIEQIKKKQKYIKI